MLRSARVGWPEIRIMKWNSGVDRGMALRCVSERSVAEWSLSTHRQESNVYRMHFIHIRTRSAMPPAVSAGGIAIQAEIFRYARQALEPAPLITEI